jgi:GTP-binding protein HflX
VKILYENKIDDAPVKAVLVCVDTGEFDAEISIAELGELARSANAEVVGEMIQKKSSYDSATCMGSGRLEELREQLPQLETELVIFDHELTGVQVRNIKEILDVRVIDRTTLILDIFAQRARTKEGKLQVELAQQKYRLPRLIGLGTALSRLGGGIGTRGPGETKLETDKRHIRRKMETLKEQLKDVEHHREQLRKRRDKDGVITVAIVGYTNAGKSTLMNYLTEAGVLAENKLFCEGLEGSVKGVYVRALYNKVFTRINICGKSRLIHRALACNVAYHDLVIILISLIGINVFKPDARLFIQIVTEGTDLIK